MSSPNISHQIRPSQGPRSRSSKLPTRGVNLRRLAANFALACASTLAFTGTLVGASVGGFPGGLVLAADGAATDKAANEALAAADNSAAAGEAKAPLQLADSTPTAPKRLGGVDVNEKLETDLPKQLKFRDEQGNAVTLGDYFDGVRPLIITLNYSDCPMLCSLQLNGFVEGMKQMDWSAGKEFRVLTISLDPAEEPERALKTKQRYLLQYGRQNVQDGWHFLTGSQDNIEALADAIGFQYGYNEVRKEYVHPAALVMITPQGKIARYLYGIEYHPKTLRLGLVESSEGKIGTTVDKLILYCFHYDSSEGRYAPVAMNIMQVAAGSTALVLGGVLSSLWAVELRRRRKRQQKTAALPPTSNDESTHSDLQS